MKKKNKIIWFYTFEFLNHFKSLHYDSVPMNLLLLRDFQKFVTRYYKEIHKPLIKEDISPIIQSASQPYLIQSDIELNNKGYTLVQAELCSIFEGVKEEKIIYLTHNKNEYLKIRKNKLCHPLYFIGHILEADILNIEEVNFKQSLNEILNRDTIPELFKEIYFQKWLKKKVAKKLSLIRKVHFLFDHFPISKTVYGSTINRHGSLITTFAQSRNIQTLNIQHGVLGEIGHLPINADLNLVWNKADLDYLASYGVSKEKFKIIGPVFAKSRGGLVQSNSLINNNELRVLVAMQPLGFQYNKKMMTIIEEAAIHSSPEIMIKYKLHPDQKKIEKYRKLIMRNQSSIIPHGSTPLKDLIQESNLIITPFSTVAYEALLQEKTVVFYSRKSREEVYYLEGEIHYIDNGFNTEELFNHALNDPSYLTSVQSNMRIKDSNSINLDAKQNIWKVIYPKRGIKDD